MSATIRLGVPMNIRTLDTMRIGCDDSIKNGINIPINPNYCKQEYNETYKVIQQQVSGHKKGDINLDLQITAKPGHNFYSYDGEYDYNYAAYIKNGQNEYTLVRIPAELTDEERNTVNKIVYRNRDNKKKYRSITAQLINDTYLNDFTLFIDGLQRDTYRATWMTTSGDGTITVIVSDINTSEYKTQIQIYGNVKYR